MIGRSKLYIAKSLSSRRTRKQCSKAEPVNRPRQGSDTRERQRPAAVHRNASARANAPQPRRQSAALAPTWPLAWLVRFCTGGCSLCEMPGRAMADDYNRARDKSSKTRMPMSSRSVIVRVLGLGGHSCHRATTSLTSPRREREAVQLLCQSKDCDEAQMMARLRINSAMGQGGAQAQPQARKETITSLAHAWLGACLDGLGSHARLTTPKRWGQSAHIACDTSTVGSFSQAPDAQGEG